MYKTFVPAAGHGGGDSGATFGAETEATDAIIQNKEVAETLINLGFAVSYIPDNLNYRPAVAEVNRRYPTYRSDVLALEIHKNSGTTKDRLEVYYRDGNERMKNYATRLAAALSKHTGIADSRAMRDISPRFPNGLYWCKQVIVDALLIEMGFIEVQHDEKALGRALAFALAELEGVKPKEEKEEDMPLVSPKKTNLFEIDLDSQNWDASKPMSLPAMRVNDSAQQGFGDVQAVQMPNKSIKFLDAAGNAIIQSPEGWGDISGIRNAGIIGRKLYITYAYF